MDTTVRTIKLGGREFQLPMLAPDANRKAFPLCIKLSPLVNRTVKAGGIFEPTEAEYADVLDVLKHALKFATPPLDPSDFDQLACKPQSQFDALLVVRLQTGGWELSEKPEGGSDQGEAKGSAAPAS